MRLAPNRSQALRPLLAAAILTLTACGGGGDGGPAPAPIAPTPPAPAPVAVSLTNPQPATLTADINAGETTPAATLSASLVGDLNALAGRTLFVVVEDPAQLYASTATLSVDTVARVGRIALTGRAQTTAANRSGTLRVLVCLDAGCATQLGGSPLSFPYRVTIHPGLVLPETVDIALDFGTLPTPREVPFTLPFGVVAGDEALRLVAQGSTNVFADPGRPGFFSTLVPTTVDRPGSKLVVRPRLVPPGTYSTPYTVRSDWVAGNGPASRLQTLRVNYTVRATSVPVVFNPAVLNVTVPAGREQGEFVSIDAVAQAGSVALTEVVVLDAPPPGADPSAPYASWISSGGTAASTPGFITSFAVSTCVRQGGLGGPLRCMVPGTYRGEARFMLSIGGTTQPFAVPVNLTVVP